MADVAADEEVDRARGARAHPLDLRVRRHRRARGDAAAPRHGRGRGRRDGRGGDRARDRGAASRACPRYEDDHRQHRRARVPEGPRAPQRAPARATSRCAIACARRCSCPSRSASPSCCARCRPRSSTWRSSSTSTAAPPGSSRWRTCSRRSSARSPTSTTSRSPAVEQLADGALRVPGPHADRRGQRGARRRAARRRSGTRSAGSCSTCSATCPTRARRVRVPGPRVPRPSGCRAGGSCRCCITPVATADDDADDARRTPARRSAVASAVTRDVPLGVRHARRPAQRREVDAREPDRRHEGRDRLRPAADDAHARSAGCAPRPTPRSCCSTRRASTSRARCSASAPTSGRVATLAEVDVVCLARRGERADRPRRPVRRRARAAGRHAEDPRGEQGRPRDRRRRSASTSRSRRGELGEFDAYVPLSALHRRGRRRAGRRARGPAARRARSTTRTAS